MTTLQNEPKLGPFPGIMAKGTALAAERLKAGKPGESIDRKAMATVTGESCELGTLGYAHVNSAIKHVESYHRIVWRWSQPEQAWKCLGSADCVGETLSTIHAARRRAKRALRVAQAVDVKELDPEKKRDHTLNLVAASMMATSGSGAFRKRLTGLADNALKEPDAHKLLELFKT